MNEYRFLKQQLEDCYKELFNWPEGDITSLNLQTVRFRFINMIAAQNNILLKLMEKELNMEDVLR